MYRQIRMLVHGGYACLAVAGIDGAAWIRSMKGSAFRFTHG